LLIEDALKDLSGVKSVKASFKKNLVEIEHAENFDRAQAEAAIRACGYQIGFSQRQAWFPNPRDYLEILAALIHFCTRTFWHGLGGHVLMLLF
jgi:hypothetical protein